MTNADFRTSNSMDRSLRLWKKNIEIEIQKINEGVSKLIKTAESLVKVNTTNLSSLIDESQSLMSLTADSIFDLDSILSEVDGCELTFNNSSPVVNAISETTKELHSVQKNMELFLKMKSKGKAVDILPADDIKEQDTEMINVLNDFQITIRKLTRKINSLVAEFEEFFSKSEDLRQKRIL